MKTLILKLTVPIGLALTVLSVGLAFLTSTPSYAAPLSDATPPSFNGDPLLTPTAGVTLTTQPIAFDWADALDDTGVASYTLRLVRDGTVTTTYVTTASTYMADSLTDGSYTWQVQAHDAAGNISGYSAARAFTFEAAVFTVQIFLPTLSKPDPLASCPPVTQINSYQTIPIAGPRADRPDSEHADLNLELRGYQVHSAPLGLVPYSGPTDTNAPQLDSILGRLPTFTTAYRANNWIWNCGDPKGCRGAPITNPDVTMIGFQSTRGEAVNIANRGPEIYPGSYKAMVLYADEKRITLGYTRDDTVANGYAVHMENVCVDPNLLALYRAQVGADGFRSTMRLPALREGQSLGVALNDEIQIVVRDRGAFMDPRSKKDWWFGYRPAWVQR